MWRNTRLTLLMLLLLHQSALAFTRGVDPWARISADKTRILVVRRGTPPDHPTKPFVLSGKREIDLVATFPKSGVYNVSDFSPVYQMNWYAYDVGLMSSPDLEDLAWVNENGLESTWGLAFYHMGKLTRSYSCPELLGTMCSPAYFRLTTANYHWDWYDEFSSEGRELQFSTQARTFGTSTLQLNLGRQDHYRFDLRTGDILSHHSAKWGRVAFIIAALATLIPIAAGTLLYLRRKKILPCPATPGLTHISVRVEQRLERPHLRGILD